jgi:hypothetical protein
MGKKRPWCERASRLESAETINDKQVLKHSKPMFLGTIIQIGVFSGFLGLHGALIALFIFGLGEEKSPYDPGFFVVAVPMWFQWVGILIGVFLLSLTFTLPARRVLKQRLIPIRCQRCPKCFYNLSKRPRDDDVCPECGVIAPRRECVRLWCKLLRSRF